MSTREQQAREIIATREQNARAMEPEIAAWQREIGPTPSTSEIAISPLNVPLVVGDDMDAGRRARNGAVYTHNAIDVFAQTDLPRSDVRIVATVSGRVLFVGEWDPASGQTVFIGGRDGRIYGYSHLESSTLQVGQSVTQGDIIGVYGNSGNATHHEGGNLHYTVRVPIPVSKPAQTDTTISASGQLQPNLSVANEASPPSRLSDFMKVWPTINGVEAKTGMTFQPGISQAARTNTAIEAHPPINPTDPATAPTEIPTLPDHVHGGQECTPQMLGAPCRIPFAQAPNRMQR